MYVTDIYVPRRYVQIQSYVRYVTRTYTNYDKYFEISKCRIEPVPFLKLFITLPNPHVAVRITERKRQVDCRFDRNSRRITTIDPSLSFYDSHSNMEVVNN